MKKREINKRWDCKFRTVVVYINQSFELMVVSSSIILQKADISMPRMTSIYHKLLTTIGGRLRSHLVPSGPIGTTNLKDGYISMRPKSVHVVRLYICKDQDEPNLEVLSRLFGQELGFPWGW